MILNLLGELVKIFEYYPSNCNHEHFYLDYAQKYTEWNNHIWINNNYIYLVINNHKIIINKLH